MRKIKQEQYFYATDGKVIKSLEELPKALEQMHNGAFSFHANESKNDFANWVSGVFNKKALANRLQNTGSRQEAIAIVKQALVRKPRSKRAVPKKLEKLDPKEQGYFSDLESLILKKKLPENMLKEMKKYWK